MKLKEYKVQVKEILRFFVGGGSAVVTDYAVYRILLSAGWDLSVSKAFSYICGAFIGFLINKRWTFESKEFSGLEILKYVILYVFSAGVHVWVNKTVLAWLPIKNIGYLCATGFSTVINFLGQKFFVFTKK